MKRWTAITLLLCLLLSCTACRISEPIQNIIRNPPLSNTTALKIGTHKISTVELNYFYIDAIQEYTQYYGDYIDYLMDGDKPLNEQFYNVESGKTWADYFVDTAIDKAHNVYALYDTAITTDYAYTPEESVSDSLKVQAAQLGFKSVDDYLQNVYGDGATESTYLDYYEKTQIAAAYYTFYSDTLLDSYTAEDLRAFERGSEYLYNRYSYASYYLNAIDFESENELNAAIRTLAASENNTVEKLNEAIFSMFSTGSCTENIDVQYHSIQASVQDWIRDESLKAGDITAIANVSFDAAGNKTIKGYHICLYLGCNKNLSHLVNVRHILIAHEGGVYDKATGRTEYSEAEIAATLQKANDILRTWESGDGSEDSFADLAKVHTTDPTSRDNGGLYTDIYPGQMVSSFDTWCFADDRTPGDTGIVLSDYGAHIMYYVSDSDMTYRDYQIIHDLLAKDMEEWQTERLDASDVEELDLSHVNRTLILKKGISEE